MRNAVFGTFKKRAPLDRLFQLAHSVFEYQANLTDERNRDRNVFCPLQLEIFHSTAYYKAKI